MRPYKVYLAARYSRKNELRGYASELAEFGVEITSSWLKEEYDPNVSIKELTDRENYQVALQDLEDIVEADTMVFFAEDQNNQPPRGGRHCEFGFALALKLRIVVIGEKENVFHYLPEIVHYPSWREFVDKELSL